MTEQGMFGSRRNRRMLAASAVGAVQRAAQFATALIVLPLALNALGVGGFGVWGAATSLAWVSGLLDLGLGSALITLLPRAIAAGRDDLARAHVGAALLYSCVLAGAILLGGYLFVRGGLGSPASAPFTVAIVGLAVNVPLSIATSVWFGLQRGYIGSAWELAQTAITLILIVIAARWHAGVTAMVGVVYAPLLLCNFGSLLHLLWRHPEIRPRRIIAHSTALRAVLRQSGMLFTISAAGASSYLFDNVLTLHWLGVTASAQMTMVMRVCTTAAGLLAVLTQPLWPALVEAEATGDRAWSLRTLRAGTAMTAALALGGGICVGLFGRPVLVWWLHRDIGIRPELLWAAGIWIVVMCTPRVAALLLNAALVLRLQLIASLVALAVALALKVLLAPYFGAAGVLSATFISALLIMWPVYFFGTARWTASARHHMASAPDSEPF